MTDFVKRIKKDINDPRNHFQFRGKTLVDDKDLQKLIYHFESLDSAARADHDCKIPDKAQMRQQCLVHEVQAAFHNLGPEETLDTVMFTIYELRKYQIKNLSINKEKRDIKIGMSIF